MKTLHFIGDSLIEYFDWSKRFPSEKVINSGIAGETVGELLYRSDVLAGHTPQPEWFIIMIGTNNVAMQDFSFLPDYEKIVETFQAASPKSKIVIHGLFPIELQWVSHETILSLNQMIEALAHDKQIIYLNGCDIFDKNNKNVRYFLEDGVHISATGYSIWADALKKIL